MDCLEQQPNQSAAALARCASGGRRTLSECGAWGGRAAWASRALRALSLALLAPLAICTIGCDAKPELSTTQDATRPAEPAAVRPPAAPTTLPAATPANAPEEFASYLYIQYPTDETGASVDPVTGALIDPAAHQWGIPRQFPPARLRLTGRGDDGVAAMLFSDDPKEAINKNYAGNSYFFLMKLPQAINVREIDGARYWFQSSPDEREDSSDGIFLRGDRFRIEPTNVIVQFEGAPPNVTVHLRGEFLQHDTTNPKDPAITVFVQGVLMPRVELKE